MSFLATAIEEDPKIQQALQAFEEIGKRDPKTLTLEERVFPRQLGEAQLLLGFVLALTSKPSKALLLACHCQHLGRFKYPRDAFPQGREGYRAWRIEAARRSAAEAARILSDLGFEPDVIEAVAAIVTKRGRGRNPDTQTMEDALCLCFLTVDAKDFATRHSEDEMIVILRRSWLKMSEAGRALALEQSLPPTVRALVEKALASDNASDH